MLIIIIMTSSRCCACEHTHQSSRYHRRPLITSELQCVCVCVCVCALYTLGSRVLPTTVNRGSTSCVFPSPSLSGWVFVTQVQKKRRKRSRRARQTDRPEISLPSLLSLRDLHVCCKSLYTKLCSHSWQFGGAVFYQQNQIQTFWCTSVPSDPLSDSAAYFCFCTDAGGGG